LSVLGESFSHFMAPLNKPIYDEAERESLRRSYRTSGDDDRSIGSQKDPFSILAGEERALSLSRSLAGRDRVAR